SEEFFYAFLEYLSKKSEIFNYPLCKVPSNPGTFACCIRSIVLNQRLKKQFEFIKTLDEMKSIFRMTNLIGSERKENDAEHTFHIATMAVILHEYADEEVDLEHVIKLLLFHDIVEIDAGDTFAYDKEHNKSKLDREKKAAEHLYGLL